MKASSKVGYESVADGLLPERFRKVAKSVVPFWVLAVLIGSFLPGHSKQLLGTEPNGGHYHVALQHRLSHFVVFGSTALLFLLTAERQRDEAWLAAAAFFLGCFIELLQFAKGLTSVLEWWDVRDDFFSVAAVYLLFGVALLPLRGRFRSS